jgi:hypothetical protein
MLFPLKIRAHGVSSVLYAIHRRRSQLPGTLAARTWLGSSAIIASGGSAGPEGPIVTIGATLGSVIARALRFDPQTATTLVGCGAAAGLAAVFNAPITGIFFVLEVLLRDFSLRTFAQDLTLTGEATGLTYDSVKPVDFGAERTRTRTMSVPEFAALPDFSYSLTDWVTGNEGCDPYSDTDFERCHQFTTHMGALNSSHFVPQSRRFYEHYHLLALDRAAACAALEDSLEAAQPGAADRFESVLLACETEAMVLEAIGQHYLQDAWSMGHMWERWGGPELADHPEGLAAAQVIDDAAQSVVSPCAA